MTLEEAKKVKENDVLFNRVYQCDFVVDKIKKNSNDIRFVGYFVENGGRCHTWDILSYMDLVIKSQ